MHFIHIFYLTILYSLIYGYNNNSFIFNTSIFVLFLFSIFLFILSLIASHLNKNFDNLSKEALGNLIQTKNKIKKNKNSNFFEILFFISFSVSLFLTNSYLTLSLFISSILLLVFSVKRILVKINNNKSID